MIIATRNGDSSWSWRPARTGWRQPELVKKGPATGAGAKGAEASAAATAGGAYTMVKQAKRPVLLVARVAARPRRALKEIAALNPKLHTSLSASLAFHRR